MPKKVQLERLNIWRCDECKKEEALKVSAKRTGWFTISYTATNGLRLFEKKDPLPRYESFNIPSQEERVFCSRECILKNLTSSIDLFISEISTKSITGLHRKQIK